MQMEAAAPVAAAGAKAGANVRGVHVGSKRKLVVQQKEEEVITF